MPSRRLLIILTLAMTPGSVRAHNLGAECRQVGERVLVEAYFSDDAPARQARVQLMDAEKNVVASGLTDAKGKCTLRAPNPGQYQLVVDAGAGHRKQQPLTIVGTLPAPTQTDNAPPVGKTHREEFTRFPWERTAAGISVIALVGAAWWWSRRPTAKRRAI